jgi:hypothetical protein
MNTAPELLFDTEDGVTRVLDFDYSELSLDDLFMEDAEDCDDDAVPGYAPIFVSDKNDSPLLAFLRSSKLQNTSQHTSTTGCLTSSAHLAYAADEYTDDDVDDDDMTVESLALEYLQTMPNLRDAASHHVELQSSATSIFASSFVHKTMSLADEIVNCDDEDYMMGALNKPISSLHRMTERLNQCMDRSAQSRKLIHSLGSENSCRSLATTNGDDFISSSNIKAKSRSNAPFKPSHNASWSSMPSMKNKPSSSFKKSTTPKLSLHGTENASWERSGIAHTSTNKPVLYTGRTHR